MLNRSGIVRSPLVSWNRLPHAAWIRRIQSRLRRRQQRPRPVVDRGELHPHADVHARAVVADVESVVAAEVHRGEGASRGTREQVLARADLRLARRDLAVEHADDLGGTAPERVVDDVGDDGVAAAERGQVRVRQVAQVVAGGVPAVARRVEERRQPGDVEPPAAVQAAGEVERVRPLLARPAPGRRPREVQVDQGRDHRGVGADLDEEGPEVVVGDGVPLGLRGTGDQLPDLVVVDEPRDRGGRVDPVQRRPERGVQVAHRPDHLATVEAVDELVAVARHHVVAVAGTHVAHQVDDRVLVDVPVVEQLVELAEPAPLEARRDLRVLGLGHRGGRRRAPVGRGRCGRGWAVRLPDALEIANHGAVPGRLLQRQEQVGRAAGPCSGGHMERARVTREPGGLLWFALRPSELCHCVITV